MTVPINGTTTYTLENLVDPLCTGNDASITVLTTPAPTATLSLNGPGTICASQNSSLKVDFTGAGPYTFNYTANGIAQTPVTTSTDPIS